MNIKLKRYIKTLRGRLAKSKKYKEGETVFSTDGKYVGQHLKFVTSWRFPYGGGYVVLDRKGNYKTTTNICKAR